MKITDVKKLYTNMKYYTNMFDQFVLRNRKIQRWKWVMRGDGGLV